MTYLRLPPDEGPRCSTCGRPASHETGVTKILVPREKGAPFKYDLIPVSFACPDCAVARPRRCRRLISRERNAAVWARRALIARMLEEEGLAL
jgi:hypothetical protein